MAQAKPADQFAIGAPNPTLPTPAGTFSAGGQVGLLHSELERHFGAIDTTATSIPLSPRERAIRFLSVGTGYFALACGFIAVAVAIF